MEKIICRNVLIYTTVSKSILCNVDEMAITTQVPPPVVKNGENAVETETPYTLFEEPLTASHFNDLILNGLDDFRESVLREYRTPEDDKNG